MTNRKAVKKSLVVPVFNEEACITPFLEKIEQTFPEDTSDNLEIVFVDDGSTDTTLQQLIELQKTNNKIKIIELSRNFGKEAALLAGIKQTDGNVVIPIDVDLQDPPELIHDMIREWQAGNEVVLAVQTNRQF
jgi:glycosyltransferase involved in cell wall biosynthesis